MSDPTIDSTSSLIRRHEKWRTDRIAARLAKSTFLVSEARRSERPWLRWMARRSVARLVLDSLHADYAAVTGALNIITTEDASHDANIKLVTASDNFSRSGDLAPIARANLGVGVFKDEYVDDGDYQLRGLALLGTDPGGFSVEYVRQQQGESLTADNYGDGSGKTYGDAYNGPLDPAINGGVDETHQVGTRYYYCGEIFHAENIALNSVVFAGGSIAVADATALDPIHLRFDHPLNPGIMHGGVTWHGNGSDLSWVVHSGNVYKRGDFGGEGRTVFQSSLPQKGMDPTASAADLLENVSVKAASLGAMSAGKFWHESMSKVAVDAAIGDVGGAFTDYTTAANEDTANDVVIFANAAANDDAFYVGGSSIFSTVYQVGGTITGFTAVWEYWNGTAWANLSDISDLSDTFKEFGNSAVLNVPRVAFNAPSDWATTTVNSQGPFYYIRLRKTAGTVSGVQDKTRLYVADTTLYAQRQDNAAVTRSNEPLLRWDGGGGHYWELNTKGNYELINCRTIGSSEIWNNVRNSTEIIHSGGQYIDVANTFMDTGVHNVTFRASSDGTLFYDVSDRIVNKDHTWVVDDLIGRHGSAPSQFADMDRWCDMVYSDEGVYANNGDMSGGWNISGLYVRHIGDTISNSVGVVIDNADAGDHHSIAMRGSYDGTGDLWERFCLEYVSSAINIYTPGTGNGDAPAFGSGAPARNMTLQDFLIVQSNGVEDTAQPLGGLVFNGDADATLYDDDTGDRSGNTASRFVVADLAEENNLLNGVPNEGHAIVMAVDQEIVFDEFTVDGCNWVWANAASGQQESFSAVIQEDNSLSSFVDLTANVKDTGVTNSNFFPAAEAADDACYFGVKRQSFRRVKLNITTGAAGTYTLAFEYWDGSAWTAVSNLSDGTSNLTASGTITFDRPTDMATTTVNSQGPFYYFRIRLVSGSFTTDPVFDEARSRFVGSAAKMHNWHFRNMVHGLAWERSGTIGSNSGSIDVDNFTGELKSGETIAGTDLFKRGSSTPPIPDSTLSEFKAFSKSKTTTDATKDSVFAPNVSTTPGVDITETP